MFCFLWVYIEMIETLPKGSFINCGFVDFGNCCPITQNFSSGGRRWWIDCEHSWLILSAFESMCSQSDFDRLCPTLVKIQQPDLASYSSSSWKIGPQFLNFSENGMFYNEFQSWVICNYNIGKISKFLNREKYFLYNLYCTKNNLLLAIH